MGIQIKDIETGNATIMIGEQGQPITDVQKDQAFNSLEKSGAVLLRGFNVDLGSFSEFVGKMCSKVTLDPARTFFESNVQKVDAGTAPIGLHTENSNTPFPPDLVFFYCRKAASNGSQTTLCDGQVVWRFLSDDTRSLFRDHQLRISRNISEPHWKEYVAFETEGLNSADEVTMEHFEAFRHRVPNQKIELQDDMSIFYSLDAPGARKSLVSKQWAFANSIMGPSYNYEKPLITFDNDQAISDEILEEIRVVTEAVTKEVQWQDGDVVMIDNTRVMHGRREITDTNRELFIGLGYL